MLVRECYRRLLHDMCRSGPAAASWYPGHMSSSVRQIQDQYMKQVHMIVEVRDARLPLTSASIHLHPLIASKRRLIVLNKSDLADLSQRHRIQDAILMQSPDTPEIRFVSRRDHQTLITSIIDAASSCSRFRTTPRLVMIVGIPNVGKSSIIRSLKRDKKSVLVGARPGLTRSISRLQLGQHNLYLLDTPGILPPAIHSDVQAQQLSLIHSIPDHVVGNYLTGQYLYEIMTGMKPTETEFHEFLVQLARRRSFYLSSTAELDLDRALAFYLQQFREGDLGKFMLDQLE